jgi:hypothetical protein
MRNPTALFRFRLLASSTAPAQHRGFSAAINCITAKYLYVFTIEPLFMLVLTVHPSQHYAAIVTVKWLMFRSPNS